MPEAFYSAPVDKFINDDPDRILGILANAGATRGFGFQRDTQIAAWTVLIEVLQRELATVHGIDDAGLVIEFPIPRRNKRIDAALVFGDVVVVVEFKVGSDRATTADKEQTEDYCLDLRDFHTTSIGKTLVPILIPTEYIGGAGRLAEPMAGVVPVVVTPTGGLSHLIDHIVKQLVTQIPVRISDWVNGEYCPTPTIIEAACHLYANQDVTEIARSHAAAENLEATTRTVLEAVSHAQRTGAKTICFITGVPGAGKTLAGLNIVHNTALHADGDLGVFLSGNGPLIKVLKEALARDKSRRSGMRLKEARREASTFVQNVHRFLDTYAGAERTPPDRVVIFDEAQRAWNAEHAFRKFKRTSSEPEMMLEVMNRVDGWAVLVCLIGGGQEINTGEAGLPEWGRVLDAKYPNWRVLISHELVDGSHSTANQPLFDHLPSNVAVESHHGLHLDVSIRAFRAEKLSEWVGEVISDRPLSARRIASDDLREYPLFYTRDLDEARTWLRKVRRGSRRSGIIASSGARRLRPFGIDVTAELEVEEWFLAGPADVRSSSFLELVATEFGIQGLELDWTCLCWGADLRRSSGAWSFNQFRGTKWMNVNNQEFRQYMLNKYRVLLTRAREGMVIWIPRGSDIDQTRPPAYYNETAEYLRSCGVRPLIES